LSKIAVRARNLKKVYRLYKRQRSRLLDIVGLLPRGSAAYSEHLALDGITLDIPRGQKVAIIGRNGAGKSTLLKLVTGAIEPSSGTLDVSGVFHPLLALGVGFHPDFTGRENVLAYFAQLGRSDAEAARLCEAVVDFAELEEYIDQPVRTYSTGMALRLMFSASTAVVPDLLVLDEVLGVGDAYFTQKSFERIRELCDRDGTTVLLVTHDVYSAARFVDRMIWLDRGRVLLDGSPTAAVTAYEDAIRAQEESRLRQKHLDRLRREAESQSNGACEQLLVELKTAGNVPLPGPVYVSELALLRDGSVVATLPLARAENAPAASHLVTDAEASCWGAPLVWRERPARPFLDYGSPFRRVAGVFVAARGTAASPDLAVRVAFWSEHAADLIVELYGAAGRLASARVHQDPGLWTSQVISAHQNDPISGVNTSGVHGSGDIVIESAEFVDERGGACHILHHGEKVTLRIGYRIANPELREHAQVFVAFQKNGIQDVCRYLARDLLFDTSAQRAGAIELDIPKLGLTDGTYTVTVLVVKEGYYDRMQSRFFTINREVYGARPRMVDIAVTGSGLLGTGTMYVADGAWSIH
jgi:homopolymeric O-antigen transport system ATP-binding protein